MYATASASTSRFARSVSSSTSDEESQGRVHGERVGPEGEPELASKWRRTILAMDGRGGSEPPRDYSNEEVAWALRPTPEDGGWEADSGDSYRPYSKFQDPDEDSKVADDDA